VEQPITNTQALLRLRCPRCHAGPLFTHPATSLRHFDEMPPVCPVCRQTYEPEPGFYYGAMYVSFGFSVGVVALVGLILYFLAGDPPVWAYVTAVTGVMLVLTPLSFRYARAVMLYAFGSTAYDPARDPARK
jgi:uncharacterized protein (DUF983 family)